LGVTKTEVTGKKLGKGKSGGHSYGLGGSKTQQSLNQTWKKGKKRDKHKSHRTKTNPRVKKKIALRRGGKRPRQDKKGRKHLDREAQKGL